MMQQINLYQPIFRKQKRLFSAVALLQVSLVVLAGLFLITIYSYWQRATLEDDLAQLKVRETDMTARVETLNMQYPQSIKSKQLEHRVAQAEAEILDKRAALAKLRELNLGEGGEFSAYLEGLARQRITDLWLTSILISQGGSHLLLKGSALDPATVPRFLQRLSSETVFNGKQFKSLLMSRPEKEPWHVDFSVSTAAAGPVKQ